jgi:hypothetical protein
MVLKKLHAITTGDRRQNGREKKMGQGQSICW